MGSHGGGTPEGQREVLASYGITEEAMETAITSDTDSLLLGKTKKGLSVYFDRKALAADLVIPVNRVKPHTDFVGDIQSGICKMLAIGLGNHIGCSALHEDHNDSLGETIKEAASIIMERAKVGFGLAIVENAYDETALIEAVPSETILSREKELLKIASANMPALLLYDIDILLVGQIGKNISVNGFDPHVIGRSLLLNRFIQKTPDVRRMILLGLTPETHGNAIGIGNFDIITRNVFDGIDLESSYANAVAVKCPADVFIPLVADTEEIAIRTAAKTIRNLSFPGKTLTETIKIVKIKNTLSLDTIEISQALLDSARQEPRLEILP
jgi:hypothetical protein